MSPKKQGQSLIETMLGFIILIPIGVAAFDIVSLVASTQLNEQFAENAARAAAFQPDAAAAQTAANDAVARFSKRR